jgi:hypothetical protein
VERAGLVEEIRGLAVRYVPGVGSLCGLFNTVVDPYGLFRWIDRPGFNEIKPRATQASVAFKYRAIDFLSPRTIATRKLTGRDGVGS